MTFQGTLLRCVRMREASLQRKHGRKSFVIKPLPWLVMHGGKGSSVRTTPSRPLFKRLSHLRAALLFLGARKFSGLHPILFVNLVNIGRRESVCGCSLRSLNLLASLSAELWRVMRPSEPEP